MRYLFFNNTPAHVHLYRNAVKQLQNNGHTVKILARDSGCTLDLLDYYNLPYEIYGSRSSSNTSLFIDLPIQFSKISRTVRKFNPDMVFGVGIFAGFAGSLTNSQTIVFIDSDIESFIRPFTYRFASAVLSPYTFKSNLGNDHYLFKSLNECAYIHPKVYEPDPNIREKLGIDSTERYFVLRFNSFEAIHDIGVSGFTKEDKRRLIKFLSKYGKVFTSEEVIEKDKRKDDNDFEKLDIHPAQIHDVLAGADLFIADTQTMVTEAALLGTPAIRSNTFVGESDMGNFIELENNGLIYNFEDPKLVIKKAIDLIESNSKNEWKKKRDAYLEDKINVTKMIVDIATEVRKDKDIQTVMEDYNV